MKYEHFGLSLQGRRQINEDSFTIFLTNENVLIVGVADGMGGHRGGKAASTLTIKLVEKLFKNKPLIDLSDTKIEKEIIWIVREIQKKLILFSEKNAELDDMGTTLNLCVFIKKKVFTLNIGDSRTSQFTRKDIIQITEDHNLAALAAKDKTLARYKGFTNYLTSSLGPKKETKVDMFITLLNKQGYILLTTDGVHNFVSSSEIVNVFREIPDLESKVKKILLLAYENNSNDNMTLVLVKYDNS